MKTTNLKNVTLALLLALCMALFALPAAAQEYTAAYTHDLTVELPAESDELFALYVEQELYAPVYGGISMFGTQAGARLDAQPKLMYDVLKDKIENVASGSLASTAFSFDASDISGLKTSYTLADLGVDTFDGGDGSFSYDAYMALLEKVMGGNDVFNALLHDCPLELYWFDKANESAMQTSMSMSTSDDTVTIVNIYITMQAASAYQNGNSTTVKAANIKAITDAAQAIVDNHASKNDKEKLEAYRDEICALTSYNDEAADENNNTPYGDPWQLIYVFDGDANTEVVCEGYSKAFQYLCDLSTFKNASCITVSGMMAGGTGEGPHMWNIVTLNGVNYIVDVTNSDEGTIGQDGGLFLSLPSYDIYPQYNFTADNTSIAYLYDDETLSLWDEDSLTLGGEEHTCDFSGEPTYEYLNAAQHSVIVKCTGCGETQTTAASHTETTAATCTDAAYCDKCKHSYGEVNAAAHPASAVISYADNKDGTHTGSYSCCGAATAAEAHTFGADGKCSVCPAQAVAKVGNTAYALFDDALANWTDGTTLTLLKDVTHGSNITIKESNTVILDGGNHTLTLSTHYCIDNQGRLKITNGTYSTTGGTTIGNSGTLTITDATITSDYVAIMNDHVSNQGATKAKLTISGNTVIEATDEGILNWGYVTIESGSITSDEYSILNGGTVTINDGTLTGTIDNSGVLTVSGGTITSNSEWGIENTGDLTLSGGTISGNTVDMVYFKGTINITAGVPADGWTLLPLPRDGGSVIVGENLILPESHYLFVNDEIVTNPTYNTIGVIRKGTPHVCDFSGEPTYEYLSAAQHNVIIKCTGCGETQTTAVAHTETTAATCTAAAYCGDCKHSYGDVNTSAHPASAVISYADNGNGTHTGTYSCCGATTAAEAHAYTYTASGSTLTETCTNGCQYIASLTLIAPTELTYSANAKEATLEGSFSGMQIPVAAYNTADGSAPVDAGDYTASITVSGKTASVDFTIAPKALTAAADEVTREYAASAALKAVPLTLSGVIMADDVSGTADFILTSINVGTYTAAELTAYALTGEDADNYAIAPQDVAFTKATITKASADKWTADVAYGQDILVGSGLDAIAFPSEGTGIGNEVVAITSAAAYTDAAATVPLTQETILSAKKGDTLTLYYRITADNYADRIGEMNLYFVEHEHEWTYSAKDNVITAVCSGTLGTCPSNTVTLTLSAPADLTYTGSAKEATVTVDPAGAIAAPAVKYSAAAVNAGDYTASITMGDATATLRFTIVPAKLPDTAALDKAASAYTGEAHAPSVILSGLTKDTDFTVSYPADMVSAGEKTLTVTGIGNYEDAYDLTYEITRAPIASAVVSAADQVYTGEALEPSFTVTLGDKTLTPNVDFTYAWTNNVNAGTAKIVITGIANYEGEASGTFEITTSASALTAKTDKAAYTYGETITVTATAAATGEAPQAALFGLLRAAQPTMALYAGDVKISDDVTANEKGEYVMTYDTASRVLLPGAVSLTVRYTGNANTAAEEAAVTFSLNKKELTPVLSGSASKTYDGTATIPAANTLNFMVSGVITGDDVALSAAAFAYADANAGANKTVTASGLTLTGSDAKFYALASSEVSANVGEITKASLTAADFAFTAPADLIYSGAAKAATVTSGKTDGAITVRYSADPVNVGTYTVSIDVAEGTNHESISGLTADSWTFAIAVKTVTAPIFSGLESLYLHTGSEVKPAFTLMDGTTVIPANEYEVKYSDNVAVGTATITVTDVAGGNYAVSGTATFTIAKHAHVWTYSAKDHVITAVCSGTIGSCPNDTVTLTLNAPTDLIYTGSAKEATVTVDPAGAITAPAVAYSAVPANAGDYTASITMDDATATLRFTITPARLPDTATLDKASAVYTGSAHQPTVSIASLAEGKDFTVSYPADMISAGEKTLTVSGTGNYEGTLKLIYTIQKATLTAADFTFTAPANLIYDGAAKAATVTSGKTDGAITVKYSEEPVNVGAYTVSIDVAEGTNYESISGLTDDSWTFEITTSASALTAKADSAYTYGDMITVTAEVKATGEAPKAALFSLLRAAAKPQMALFAGDTQLTGYADVVNGKCTLTYDTTEKGILPANLVSLTVRYTGDANTAEQEATVTFALNKKKVAPALSGSVSKTYDGETTVPADHSLTLTANGVISGDTVSLSAASFAYGDADAGTGKTVTATGVMLGTDGDEAFYALSAETASASVGAIIPASIAGAVVTADNQVFTGEALKPEATVTLGGKTLVSGKDYTVSAYEDNVNVGTAKVTVTGMGNYAGDATGTFEIGKAAPNVQAPTGLTAVYGSTVGSIALPAHEQGVFSWISPSDSVGDAGQQTHKLLFTPSDTEQYITVTLEAKVTVTKADMTFGESFKVLLGGTESTVFTYGDTITVKAKPEAKRTALFALRAFSAPKADQMALFAGGTQISEAVDPDNDGVYTMTIDTTDKLIASGKNTITAKYVGTENLNDYSESVDITIRKKILTIASVTATSRVYNTGNTLVTVTGAEFIGKADASDDVNIAQVKGDVGSDAIGTYTTVLLPDTLTLIGKDASFYTLTPADAAATNVQIVAVPQDLNVEGTASESLDPQNIPDSLKALGYDTVEEIEQALSDALEDALAGEQTDASEPVEVLGTQTLDVGLIYEEDGETIEGDENHFPASGSLIVLLPVPEGTDPMSHNYSAAQILASESLGNEPGAVVEILVTVVTGNNGKQMLRLEVKDLSPVMIAWTAKDIDLPETGDASHLGLWLMLMGMSLTALMLLRKRSRC